VREASWAVLKGALAAGVSATAIVSAVLLAKGAWAPASRDARFDRSEVGHHRPFAMASPSTRRVPSLTRQPFVIATGIPPAGDS